jgi:hypothetical protein
VVVIQATRKTTTIQIDFNADGNFDSFNTENGYRTPRSAPPTRDLDASAGQSPSSTATATESAAR